MNTHVRGVVAEVQGCETIDELYKLDELIQGTDVEMDEGYRAAFDRAEARLKSHSTPLNQMTKEELIAECLRLRASGPALSSTGQDAGRPRSGGSYKVDRSVEFWPMPPQAQALARGIVELSAQLERDTLSTSELVDMAESLRDKGMLGGGQPPKRVLHYYITEKRHGFTARGLLARA